MFDLFSHKTLHTHRKTPSIDVAQKPHQRPSTLTERELLESDGILDLASSGLRKGRTEMQTLGSTLTYTRLVSAFSNRLSVCCVPSASWRDSGASSSARSRSTVRVACARICFPTGVIVSPINIPGLACISRCTNPARINPLTTAPALCGVIKSARPRAADPMPGLSWIWSSARNCAAVIPRDERNSSSSRRCMTSAKRTMVLLNEESKLPSANRRPSRPIRRHVRLTP